VIEVEGANMSAEKISKAKLLKLIDDLEKRPHDKGRILGESGIVVLGVGLGAAAAGTLAATAGATTIFGLTTAASWVGIAAVAATPVGWFVGCAAAGGAAAYGISRLIRNGGMSEGRKAELLSQYREQARNLAAKEEAGSITDTDRTLFIVALRDLIAKDVILPDLALRFIEQVERGTLPVSQAFGLVGDLLRDAQKA
jgi:hypothetical protein